VRPVSVVVPDVDAEGMVELAATENEEPVEALAAGAALKGVKTLTSGSKRTGSVVTSRLIRVASPPLRLFGRGSARSDAFTDSRAREYQKPLSGARTVWCVNPAGRTQRTYATTSRQLRLGSRCKSAPLKDVSGVWAPHTIASASRAFSLDRCRTPSAASEIDTGRENPPTAVSTPAPRGLGEPTNQAEGGLVSAALMAGVEFTGGGGVF
jgi:hypothetical protein